MKSLIVMSVCLPLIAAGQIKSAPESLVDLRVKMSEIRVKVTEWSAQNRADIALSGWFISHTMDRLTLHFSAISEIQFLRPFLDRDGLERFRVIMKEKMRSIRDDRDFLMRLKSRDHSPLELHKHIEAFLVVCDQAIDETLSQNLR